MKYYIKPAFSATLIFFGSILFYAATFNGGIVTGDNLTQFVQTLHILETGGIGFDAPVNDDVFSIANRFHKGINGKYYQIYGIGHALLAMPGTALAYFLFPKTYEHRKGLLQKAWVAHAMIFAAVIVTCCWAVFRTVLMATPTIILTVSIAAASPLWLFSDQCWNTLSEAMCLTLGLTLFLNFFDSDYENRASAVFRTENADFKFIIAGLSVGWAFIVRPFSVLTVPAFLFFIWYLQGFRLNSWRSKMTLYFVIPVAICAIFVLCFNTYRFGSPFLFGYTKKVLALSGNNGGFTTPWWNGMSGNLYAPARSLFYFAPVTALSFFAFFILAVRMPGIAVFLSLFSAPYLILMPKWVGWWGGSPDLGQRFWIPMIPAAYFILAEALRTIKTKKAAFALVSLIAILSVFGVHHQFLSSTTDGRRVYKTALENYTKITGSHGRFILEKIRENPFYLLTGQNIISQVQRIHLKTDPKEFGIVGSFRYPQIRAVIGGIIFLIAVFTATYLRGQKFSGKNTS